MSVKAQLVVYIQMRYITPFFFFFVKSVTGVVSPLCVVGESRSFQKKRRGKYSAISQVLYGVNLDHNSFRDYKNLLDVPVFVFFYVARFSSIKR